MRVAIAGAGAVGRSIARELVDGTHEVLLIERTAENMDPTSVPQARWHQGDACEVAELVEVELHAYDVVIAATGDDKTNLVLSLLAKTEFGVPRVVARVNDPRNEWLFDDSWGVDVAVSTPRMLAALVEEAVNVGDLVTLMSLGRGDTRLVGLTLPSLTPLAGKAVGKLRLPRGTALVAVIRGHRVIVPRADDPLEGDDELLFVARHDDIDTELRTALGL